MIDTSAASPDKQSPSKPGSPSIIDFKFKSRLDLTNADDIWERAEFGYYHCLQDLIADFDLLFKKVLSQRCLNLLAKVYLSQVFTKTVKLISQKHEDFKTKWRLVYENRFNANE